MKQKPITIIISTVNWIILAVLITLNIIYRKRMGFINYFLLTASAGFFLLYLIALVFPDAIFKIIRKFTLSTTKNPYTLKRISDESAHRRHFFKHRVLFLVLCNLSLFLSLLELQ